MRVMSRKLSQKKRSESHQLRRKTDEEQSQNKKKTESKLTNSVQENKEGDKGCQIVSIQNNQYPPYFQMT